MLLILYHVNTRRLEPFDEHFSALLVLSQTPCQSVHIFIVNLEEFERLSAQGEHKRYWLFTSLLPC